MEIKRVSGDYIDPPLGRVMVKSLAPAFLAKTAHALKQSAYGPLETAWKAHVEPRCGGVEIREIRPSDVEEWIRQVGLGTAVNAALVARAPDDDLGLLVMLLAYAGLRWGEAVALRARDMEFRKRRISVERSATQIDGYVVLGTPKSWERRSVPMPRLISDPLAARIMGRSPDALIFERSSGGFLACAHS